MKKTTIIRLTALILVICALAALTACKRDGGDGPRMDITVNTWDYSFGFEAQPPPRDDYVDLGDLVPRPERRLPFEPVEDTFVYDNAAIKMIEINQCLSYGFDTETGELYIMENFVAGKETAIFVAFEEPFDLRSEAVLTIERDGDVIAQLSPAAIPDEYTLLFQPIDTSEVDNWQAGAYSFRFDMDGGHAVRTANFYDSIPLRILAVPVLANYAGNVVACEGNWFEGITMMIAEYPVARANIEYILGPELDLSDSRYDITNEEYGMRNVWEALCRLQREDDPYTLIVGFVRNACGANRRCMGYTYPSQTAPKANIVVGNTPDWITTIPHEVAHCYGIGDEYPGGSLALEVNAPPYRMEGHVMGRYEYRNGQYSLIPIAGDNPNVLGGQSFGLDESGSWVYPEQRPYWVEGRALLRNVTSYMGWCTGGDPFMRWTSSEIWNHIYNCFVGHSTAPGSGGNIDVSYGPDYVPEFWGQCTNCYMDVYDPNFYVECWQCHEFVQVTGREFECSGCGAYWWLEDYEDDLYLECPECRYFIWYDSFEEHNSGYQVSAQRTSQGQFLQISGHIENNEFTPMPWYAYGACQEVVTPSWAGAFSAQVYSADGELLAISYFNIEGCMEVTSELGVERIAKESVPMYASVRLPEGASRVVLYRGDDVMYEQNVTQNAPTVSFTNLSDGQQLGDSVNLTWDAYDADGDEIFFDIWYFANADTCFSVAADVTGRSFDVDLSMLPGSNAGYFRILATDGALTTEAFSPVVKVPYKAPLILTELDTIPEFKLTDEVLIDVEIYDFQDGWMWGGNPGTSVVWSGWPDGHESHNSVILWGLPFQLPPGTHTFTCTVTNTAGLSASRDYSIRVIDDASALPLDWSSAEVRQALSRSFILPLNRLDAPVTRGDYAAILANFYILVSGGIDIPFERFYDEDAIRDCGGAAWEPHFMNYLGIMEVTDGLFEPGKSVGELEAVMMLFKTYALAMNDPDALADIGNTQRVIPAFHALGILNSEGNNAFRESERLTNRLAMVRINRFFSAVFSDDTGVSVG